jgi:hypothetical protein
VREVERLQPGARRAAARHAAVLDLVVGAYDVRLPRDAARHAAVLDLVVGAYDVRLPRDVARAVRRDGDRGRDPVAGGERGGGAGGGGCREGERRREGGKQGQTGHDR